VKIYAGHDGGSGCAWYRMIMPMRELAKHGHELDMAGGDDPHGGNRPGIQVLDARKADITTAERLDTFDGLSAWRRLAPFTRLVYEIDDDVFSLDPVNFGPYQTYSRGDVRDAIAHYAEVSHMVTVTCEPLAEVMREFSGNVVILPNHIPAWVLDLPAPRGERPAVGWMGGSSHGMDILQATGPLQKFLRKFPAWDAVLIGTDYRPAVRHKRCGYIPWTHVTKDPEGFYRSIDFEIGIAPLADTRFNRSKSYLKALEYAARGIPVIASDAECYRPFVVDGVTGFLVRSQNEWLDRLCTLASDDDLRASMGAKAKEVARLHTIEDGWRKWEAAYEGLLR